jgi:hypothetical protein
VVDRLARFHFYDGRRLLRTLDGQDQIWKELSRADFQGYVALIPRVDVRAKPALPLRLKLSNHPVVLNLLADRPYENGHSALRRNGSSFAADTPNPQANTAEC